MANMTTEEDMMLRMHDIHKSFGEVKVLKGIDIEVRRGEVLAIIGPSGSGKSTAATMLLSIVGFMILYTISAPMNVLRGVILGGCIVGLLFCSIFLNDLFGSGRC